MSEATHWSYPNPVNGRIPSSMGMVYMGEKPCTAEMLLDLYEVMGEKVAVDRMSLVGTHHPDYNSYYYYTLEKQNPNGGKGSKPYEKQHVGSGVDFTKEPIWVYINGELVKEIPPNCGAHHTDAEGLNQEGPAPGSEAEDLLGPGNYVYNSTDGWYEIEL